MSPRWRFGLVSPRYTRLQPALMLILAPDGGGAVAVQRLAVAFERLGARGFIRSGFVESTMHERLQEHASFYGEILWIMMMLEQWLARHAPATDGSAL